MERHLRDSTPQWALVVWPDIPKFAEDPGCIPLHEVAVAVTQGAVIVGIEDDEFCKPRERVMAEPIVLRIRQDNPHWFDSHWGYDRR